LRVLVCQVVSAERLDWSDAAAARHRAPLPGERAAGAAPGAAGRLGPLHLRGQQHGRLGARRVRRDGERAARRARDACARHRRPGQERRVHLLHPGPPRAHHHVGQGRESAQGRTQGALHQQGATPGAQRAEGGSGNVPVLRQERPRHGAGHGRTQAWR